MQKNLSIIQLAAVAALRDQYRKKEIGANKLFKNLMSVTGDRYNASKVFQTIWIDRGDHR